jgi:hypothetical protein
MDMIYYNSVFNLYEYKDLTKEQTYGFELPG